MNHKRKFRKGIAQLLRFFLPARRRLFKGALQSIVILAPERYGDAILITPLLKRLSLMEPRPEIHLVAFRKSSVSFFGQDPHVSSVFYIKKGLIESIVYLLKHRFDVLYNPKDSPSINYLFLSVLLRARYKVAHTNEYYQGLFDCLIDREYFSHVRMRNGALLDALGIPCENFVATNPYLPPMPERDEIAGFCREIRDRGVVGINISAGNAPRYWSIDKWTALIGSFPELTFIVFSDPKDLSMKETIQNALHNILPSPLTVNLLEAGRILRELKLLVTPDTSFVHMASCFDTPVVGLYRNRKADLTRFSPMSFISRVVVSPDETVQSIPVQSVVTAVVSILEVLG